MMSECSSNCPVIDPSQWVDVHGETLFRYAVSRLRDTNAAEEVVQETFLAGVRHHEQYLGHGSERGWLTGILKRKIVDHVRARMRRERTCTLGNADPSGLLFDANSGRNTNTVSWSPAPNAKIELAELWGVVKDCLQTLPVGQADVFTLVPDSQVLSSVKEM